MSKVPRALSVFALAMINIAAIGSVKNWPVMAEFGFASIFFFLLAALVFFIPASLVSAELATGWPKLGGVFVWVKEAFGHRTGFLAIWLMWIENVIWYPTVLAFIAATIAYIFSPGLADNAVFTSIAILVIFWGTTAINLLGMRTSSLVSSASVIFGAFIPAGIIILLGLFWLFSGNPIQINLSMGSFIPSMGNPLHLVFFTGVLLSLAGMEMSAVHARDVQNPQRDYPRAIFLSAALILILSILGVLAIAMVVPQSKISLVAGSLQAFSYFVNAYGMGWLTPFMAILIAIGALGAMSTWMVGPSRGLLAAAQSGDLPPSLRKINRHGMPVTLLVVQGIIVSILSLVFLLMPSVNSAFWILSAMVAQVYLIMYILMFAAAIKLRYKKPDVERAYKIPGGKRGIWIVAGTGIVASAFAIIIGFFPPSEFYIGSTFSYLTFLILGIVVICFIPALILRFQKPNWVHPLHHERDHHR
jgi:putative glutamate/gamma-aminobutyrate antiporter